MFEHVFILSWIGSIFCVHFGYILYNIKIFSGFKCSGNVCISTSIFNWNQKNLVVFWFYIWGKFVCMVCKMMAKLKCWNIFVICYEYIAVLFLWAFSLYFMEYHGNSLRCWRNCNLESCFLFCFIFLKSLHICFSSHFTLGKKWSCSSSHFTSVLSFFLLVK